MKIAILGYGKMGKVIERAAIDAGHEIVLKIDSESDWSEFGYLLKKADVAIDFSSPEVVISNILRCFDANVSVVVGTTAWEKGMEDIREACIKGNHSLFVAANFSIGVNIFNKINKSLATLMNDQPQYGVRINETHHVHKLDRPSGTAKLLANEIIQQLGRKEKWVNHETLKSEELEIISERIDEVPGTHVVTWFSDEDEIQIRHRAKSRIGFATGALTAAQWLVGKKGFYSMDDMLFG